ncbi:MAG: hypothetical protein AAGI14_13005 [Pseudomonadota bacterium]
MSWAKLSNEDAAEVLRKTLLGSSINSITCFITGWELRLTSHPPSLSEEYYLEASEIIVPNENEWWASLKETPVSLAVDHDDDLVLASIILFRALNMHSIKAIEVLDEGDIYLTFQNDTTACIKGRCDPVDWTWDLKKFDKSHLLKCEFGEIFAPSN